MHGIWRTHLRCKARRAAGADHVPWLADADAAFGEIGEFLTGARPMTEPDRVLATVLFTDIVSRPKRQRLWVIGAGTNSSTATICSFARRSRAGEAARLAPRAMASLPCSTARRAPCNAPVAIVNSMRSLGLEVRCGLHRGECETIGDNVGGIAVAVGPT